MKLEVKQDEKTQKWGLYVDGALIGESKARYDADFAKQVIKNAQINKFEKVHNLGE